MEEHFYADRTDLRQLLQAHLQWTVRVEAAQRPLVIEHDKHPIKQIPIKGLYNQRLSFETYFDAMREEARLDWHRMLQERQRRVAM